MHERRQVSFGGRTFAVGLSFCLLSMSPAEVFGQTAPEQAGPQAESPEEEEAAPAPKPVAESAPPAKPATEAALAPKPTPEKRLTLELYGDIFPFAEHVWSTGASAPNFPNGASQVTPQGYTGFNARPRFRMTAGTSNFGLRGVLRLVEQLTLTYQVESAVPIDGNGPPNTVASRNSHIGFTGAWGTLIYGHWDTPWKWATLVTINPLPGGFVPDYTSILSTPGFGVAAINSTSLLQGSISNAAFYRREPNSVQYWSPTIAGFSARLNYTFNEARSNPEETVGPGANPYLLSGYLGFDGAGLRIRYAYELHKDYFGMSQLGGTVGPSDEVTASTDYGHSLTVQYVLPFPREFRTRLVASGEFLSYEQDDINPEAIDSYSRFAYYGLIEQALYQHHVWAAYGMADSGECGRVNGTPCNTKGLRAQVASLGYLFAFNEATMVYFAGYHIINDVSSNHSTVPILQPDGPGADVTGLGIGLFFHFGVETGL